MDNHRSGTLSRREMLAGLTAIAAGAALPSPAWSQATDKAVRIDVHRHFLTPETVGSGLLTEPAFKRWTLDSMLGEMDQGGVTAAVLSPTTQLLTATAAGGLVTAQHYRVCNDYAARLVGDSKGRFGFFAGIPLTDTNASLAEIAYAFDVLKADGVAVFTSYGNQWLGNAAFDPVFAELNRRKAVIFVHPVAPSCCSQLIPEVNDNQIAFGTDTTYAIASMILTGASQRFPDVRMIFCHGGGTMPFLIRRFITDAASPRMAKLLPNGFMPEFQRFYFDIAQIPLRPPLLAFKEVAPLSHMLFGTDYPFRTAGEHVAGLAESQVFSAEDLSAIDRNTALLVPRFRI